MRLIKRYSNRKLYDTETRTYITLDGVAKLVAAGEEIKVVENDNDEDITTVILSQILYEREREQRFLPTSMLNQLLRVGGDAGRRLGSTLTRPFSMPLTQFLEQEIERTFKFWSDISQEREEEMLRFIERLIEQRRRAIHGTPAPEEEEVVDQTPKQPRPKTTNRLDNFKEFTD